MASAIAVRCEGITKSYISDAGETPALRGINLEVAEGELFMLVGPSGCGKTTLISVIAAILNADSGECTVLSRKVEKMTEGEKTAFRGKEVGFVFQAYNLIPTLTNVENVAIPLLLNKLDRAEAIERAQEGLSLVGLGNKLHSYPHQLSGGQQQRVAVARALVHKPRIVVCDEPTSALDKDTGHQVMDIFREVALKDKRTLIIVTHDSRIFSYADRIARMNDGVIEKVVTSAQELNN